MKNKKVVIWGTAVKAQITFDLLREIDEIKVVAFGDNNEKRQGLLFNNLPVIGISDISLLDFDYFVIASGNYAEEIYSQLTELFDFPVYKSISELFRRFSLDISGWCNAKCKWCSTGRKNWTGENGCKRDYMSISMFERVYKHLCDIDLLHSFNELLLYSWGEPFLNPDFKNIMKLLHDNKQVFSISTNASAPQYMQGNEKVYEYCNTVTFSMCGFSQSSYDHIHKFNFAKIKSNIISLLENMREHGFKGNAIISYHVYQFNEHELNDAKEFAESLKIRIEPVKAYFASYDMAKAYLTNQLDGKDAKDASKELLLSHVKELINNRPTEYRCLVENMVSLHWNGKIELCCCCDDSAENFLWDDIFKIHSLREWQKYRKTMLESNTCNECRALGIDYWFFNNPIYEG